MGESDISYMVEWTVPFVSPLLNYNYMDIYWPMEDSHSEQQDAWETQPDINLKVDELSPWKAVVTLEHSPTPSWQQWAR